MKYIQTIIILIFVNLSLAGQTKYLVDFNSVCKNSDTEVFEDIYLLKKQIVAYDLKFKLLSLELVATINCNYGDTGYFKFSEDTLFLYTSNISWTETDHNGDTLVMESVAECDCAFTFQFDIYGFSKMPETILFNDQILELNNIKYKKGVTQKIKGVIEVLSDDCGYTYTTNYNELQELDQIWRIKGVKLQRIQFDKTGEVTKISTTKVCCPYDWETIKIKN